MNRIRLVSSVLAFVALGCSEAKSTDGSGGGDATGTSASASGGAGQGGGATTSASTSVGGGAVGAVVVNEVSAADDWVELYNPSGAMADLSGLMLADQDTPGVPKTAEGITFPEGTTLGPGAYLFVLAKQTVDPGEQAPQTVCAPGSSPCFYAPFGLSDSNGDAVFLLDGSDVLDASEYPAGAVGAGETWCRLPNGTGAFDACAATPSAANAAP
jgi:hypothetical protein